MRQSKIAPYFQKTSSSAKFLSSPKTYRKVELIAQSSSPKFIGSAVNMARVVPGNDSPAPMKRTQNEGHITKNSLDLHTEPLELTGDRRRNRPIPMLTIKACQSNLNLLAAQSKQ
ncbi:hypothetical protein MIR68_009313 [Amoeboaphelidium protococcarum]|nr:hypothetical protein MIR68_009313 [Amoeboaphelidium protococcarum]KAI3645934.1 hypothetical protein MP228_008862 [Amoeboaphelidium protococcarum]KAI3649387.1 hypothetical protein MP228_005759 [Amoeboaphelidium protococcarum]KAI3649902.1 hypothetical protein MP228_005534 [Amoeboaphelidium protococcarum]